MNVFHPIKCFTYELDFTFFVKECIPYEWQIPKVRIRWHLLIFKSSCFTKKMSSKKQRFFFGVLFVIL